MQIISHRGLWTNAAERNTATAFARSFGKGFGTETDLRDAAIGGMTRIVVSHDPATGGEMTLEEFLRSATDAGQPLLALNIKADGLAHLLKAALAAFGYQNYFVFDNAVPDLLQHAEAGLQCFTRMSEFELTAPLYNHPAVTGVWIDCFKPGRWYEESTIRRILADAKSVALVAPDLHRRADELPGFFRWVESTGLSSEPRLIVCTDDPRLAQEMTQGGRA